jgi:serine/threonine protein kinase
VKDTMTTPSTEPPKSLGRYELVHLIGQGGMGEVYLAKITGVAGFEKPCIVKTILPALLKDGQFLDRFHHEAKVLVHLVHSSIAQVYDMGEANGTYYMALEYVAGVDVSYLAEQARTQGQAIPVPVALYLGQKVAEGLGYAHRKAGPDGAPLGIVHRDVSPHNVMVSYEGEVKVIDFGLAKSAARSKYTLPSTVMGKLGYMSPEQARAEPVDHRSDIYSCGVMIWELIAGRPLIAHGTVGEMMAAMSNPQVPALHELRPEVDPAIDAVLRRALAPKAQDRYNRADELARALNEQLLRSSVSLGAEEVGNFVKALCPEAFSAQRKLISRISGVRRPPSTPPAAGVRPTSGVAGALQEAQPMAGLEATSVRSLNGVQNDAQQVALDATIRPMATPLPGAVSPRDTVNVRLGSSPQPVPAPTPALSGQIAPTGGISKTKLVAAVAALLLVMIGVAGATAYFMRGQGGPPLGMAQGPGEGHPPPWHPGDRPPPPPEGMPPPPPPGGFPPPREGMPPPPGHRPSPPPEAMSPEGVAAADARPTPVVGASGSEGTAAAAPAVGVADTAAPEPAVEKGPGEAASAPKSRPEPVKPKDPKPSSEWLAVKQVLPVVQKGERYAVFLARRTGLKPDMELTVVGAEFKGKRKRLGTAKVVVIARGAARLELDDSARTADGDLFIAVPNLRPETEPVAAAPEPAPAPVPEATPAPPPAPKQLAIGVKQNSLLGMMSTGYSINSQEDGPLTNCKATIERRLQYQARSLHRGENKTIQDSFRLTAGAPNVRKGWMLIECDEGRVEVPIR